MKPESGNGRRPFILGYSLILPASWMLFSVPASILLPGHRLGIVGTGMFFMAVAAFTSWLFARRHHRPYSSSEFRRLVAYSATWAILFESIVLVGVVILPQLHSGHVEVSPLRFAWGITAVFDTLFLWLAFKYTGNRVIASSLRTRNLDQTGSPPPL